MTLFLIYYKCRIFNARQMRLQTAADMNIDTSRTNIPNECIEIVLNKKND